MKTSDTHNTKPDGQAGSEALDLDVALDLLRARITPAVTREHVRPVDAVGRISAGEIRARFASPPFHGSAMDGYAVAAAPGADLRGRTFICIGESAAGVPFTGAIEGDECVRIFTGAAVPEGALRVLLQEDCTRQGDRVSVSGEPDPRSNIRPPGHDIEAGESLVVAGRRLTPVDIARVASDGRDTIEVFSRLRVGIFSTGDELVEPGDHLSLPYGKIFESNRQMLIAQLVGLPVTCTDLGNLPDDAGRTRAALGEAAISQDFIITSGGVSVGDHDHVRGAVESLGHLEFWKLNLKPGKPLAFGRIGTAWFCGLPGNPVSAIVTWHLIARPALLAACGAEHVPPLRVPARLATPASHKAGRAEYQRGWVAWNGSDDLPTVSIRGDQSSNRLSTFQDANCLVEIPRNADDLPAGSRVAVLPFPSF